MEKPHTYRRLFWVLLGVILVGSVFAIQCTRQGGSGTPSSLLSDAASKV